MYLSRVRMSGTGSTLSILPSPVVHGDDLPFLQWVVTEGGNDPRLHELMQRLLALEPQCLESVLVRIA